jgi:hypothetical protein
MRKVHAAGLLVLSLAFTLSACGSDNNDPGITDEQGEALGAAIASQVSTLATSFTATDFTSSAVGGGLFFSRPAPQGIKSIIRAPALAGGLCPEVTGDITDADGDGVPVDATFTFLSPDCDGQQGALSFTVTGAIRVVDPSQTAVGYNGTFTNFETTFSQGNNFLALEFDGTRSVLGDATSAQLTEDVTFTVDGQQQGQDFGGSIGSDWTISFDPTNDDLEMESPLVDGSFDFDGNFHYDIGGVEARFQVSTQTPLVFDASCTLVFPFSSGEIRAHLEGEGGEVFARIVYTGCGEEPTVTFEGRNS